MVEGHMQFTQLRDANPATLTTVINHWREAAGQLSRARDAADRKVTAKLLAGSWTGPAADAARAEFAALDRQLAAGEIEANAVARAVADGQLRFAKAKADLEAVLAEVSEDEDLSVSESGVVTASYSHFVLGLLPALFEQYRVEAEAKAASLTRRIQQIIAEAGKADEDTARLVERIVSAGDDSVDFNPADAPV